MARTAIVWLRRDLRLTDNVALHEASLSGSQVAVLFVLDDTILNSPRVSPARVGFMVSALASLDDELRRYGSRLLLRRGCPSEIVPRVVEELGAVAVYANRDYTPYARKRDRLVEKSLGRVPFHVFTDRLLVAPEAIRTGSGGSYTVFTPFKNKWREMKKADPDPLVTDLTCTFHKLTGVQSLKIPSARSLGFASTIAIPPASSHEAAQRLRNFVDGPIFRYKGQRNLLADPFDDPRNGTSSLSPYIRWGLLSLRQIRAAAADAYREAPDEPASESVGAWMDEIIWHEFYTHVLWNFPHVKTRNFNSKYDMVRWRHAPAEFAAWVNGRTGYPVVDAAMRQLAATGWMHNRARMIVASFLTKSLLIDWREGESYFMTMLLDGDLAANNGGWQWAAGTGTDAQPYFRIFNPVTQSEKFDPEGAYIRKWVPEIAHLPMETIYAPWNAPNRPSEYPMPIVEHSFARVRALDAFERARR